MNGNTQLGVSKNRQNPGCFKSKIRIPSAPQNQTPMLYPAKIIWRKSVSQDKAVFSGKKQKRLNGLLLRLEDLQIHYHIEPLSEQFLEWFVPKYQANIATKENSQFFGIAERTLHNTQNSFTYHALTIFQGDTKVAGAIFSDRRNLISVAFKVADNFWQQKNLRPSPSQFIEYVLYQWALSHNKPELSMGMDSNPYGPNTAVGLAEYKLSCGYLPLAAKTAELREIPDPVTTESLFFLHNPTSRELKSAKLFTHNDELLDRLTKYTDKILFTREEITPASE